MGKRGPKPVEMGTLNVWEFEWYKALHLLRDGNQLPSDPAFERVNRREAEAQLTYWKNAKPEEILGDMFRLDSPPFDELTSTQERVRAKKQWVERERQHLREWAELERQSQIASLERQLRPRTIYAQAERREIWRALVRARTVMAVQQACQRWESLADVRGLGFTCFAAHTSTNAKEFLEMRKNVRFPQSDYADESRLEYIARGMAGVMVGKSPMTAIERLRNMKHRPGGALWSDEENICKCWRCENQRWRDLYQKIE